jgi:tRNA pseudouridine38-40 synthase
VASATLVRPFDAATVVRAANNRLPAAVRVLDATEVPATFHPQFRARSKTYMYCLWNGSVLSPFARPYVWHVPPPVLDLDAMRSAAARLLGRHDFAAFQGSPPIARTTEREVFSSTLITGAAGIVPVGPGLSLSIGQTDQAERSPLLTYEIRGDGFLRHMVRNIVGSLVEVGRGRQRPDWIADVIAARSRMAAGPTAPPEGLFLVRVEY